jgi:hypothetical protein
MYLPKCLSQFCIAMLLFSILAISFHHHDDLDDHPDCPVCKLAHSLSAVKKLDSFQVSTRISKSFHDLSAGEQPAPYLLVTPKTARIRHISNTENCRQLLAPHSTASRASPVISPILNNPA